LKIHQPKIAKRDRFPYENAMNVIKLLKRLLANDRRALSAPILALILVVVGVALTLVAASVAGSFLFGWGTAPKVTIERVDILVNPVSNNGFVTIDVRNSGGARLTNCAVQLLDEEGERITATWSPETAEINPGQTASFSANGVENLQSGTLYIAVVTCDGPGGTGNVIDKKSAVAHI
jgi:hypothetical protein